nr:hypothetical protein [Mangrovicoccus ximenensis]
MRQQQPQRRTARGFLRREDHADLAGIAEAAAQQVALADDAGAEAVVEGQVGEVAVAPPCPEHRLAERRRVRRVVRPAGQAEALGNRPRQVDLRPVDQRIGRVVAARFHQVAGDREADAQHVAGREAGLLEKAFGFGADPVQHRRHAVPRDREMPGQVAAGEIHAGQPHPVGIERHAERAAEARVQQHLRAGLALVLRRHQRPEQDHPILLQPRQQPVHRLLRHVHPRGQRGTGLLRRLPEQRQEPPFAGAGRAPGGAAEARRQQRGGIGRKGAERGSHVLTSHGR